MATYYIEQKIKAFVNQYRVYGSAGDSKGDLMAFVHQKRMALRENILFYDDESKQNLAFQVKTQNIVELGAVYYVNDESGKTLGRLKKAFGSSLLRSTWNILSNDGEKPVAIVQERSLPLAIARRVWGFIPYLGELPFIMKYHFDFIDPESKEVVGTYEKTTLLKDYYRLDVSESLAAKSDWRVLTAMGVALDALQSR